MRSFFSKLDELQVDSQNSEDQCDKPLNPQNGWPSNVPPAFSAYWTSAGCDLISLEHRLTVTLPPAVEPWWQATGNAFFATNTIHIPPFSVTFGPGLTTISTTSTTPSTSVLPPAPNSSVSPTTVTSSTSSTVKDPGDGTSSHTTETSASSPSDGATPPGTPTSRAADTSSSSIYVSQSSGPPGNFPNPPSTTISSGSSISAASPPINTTFAKPHSKTMPIVVGVVVPLVLITLGVAAFILYKRRQRARDRREWERTHEAIADAVRQVSAPAAAGLPARGDTKEPLDGDTATLFDKSGESHPKFE